MIQNKSERRFMNNSGQIKFEKPNLEWLKFSDLSHNSSSSKLWVKENSTKPPPTSNTRVSEKQSEDSNKYMTMLKKITQDTGKHISYVNSLALNQNKSQIKNSKDIEVVDSSGGTNDNLAESSSVRQT